MKLFLLVVTLSLITGCNNKRGSTNMPEDISTPDVHLSNYTMMFRADLQQAMDKSDFPSMAFREKYNIREIDNHYFIGAFIQTDDELDENILTESGVLINSRSGNVYSVLVPLIAFEDIVKLPGITIIHINQPSLRQ